MCRDSNKMDTWRLWGPICTLLLGIRSQLILFPILPSRLIHPPTRRFSFLKLASYQPLIPRSRRRAHPKTKTLQWCRAKKSWARRSWKRSIDRPKKRQRRLRRGRRRESWRRSRRWNRRRPKKIGKWLSILRNPASMLSLIKLINKLFCRIWVK